MWENEEYYEDEGEYDCVTGCDPEEYEDWKEYDGQPDELTEWMDFDPDC